MLSFSLNAQNQNTTFIHGYGNDYAVWNEMRSYLNGLYRLNLSNNLSLPTYSAITSQAVYLQNNLNQSDNLAVAYSMGGLVSRDLYRQYRGTTNPPKISKLITVGTPHQGAYIVNNIRNNELSKRIQWLINDLKAGPNSTTFGAFNIVLRLCGVKESKTIKAYINMNAQDAAASSMMRGSSFLGTLNSSSSLTNETLMRAGIRSAEYYLRPVRMYSGTCSDKSDFYETQTINTYIHYASYWYSTAIVCMQISEYFYTRYTNPYDPYFGNTWMYYLYVYWRNLAYQWARGWNAAVAYFPFDWDLCTGAVFKQGNTWYWTFSDGLLTTGDQTFPNTNNANWLGNFDVMEGVNHLQQPTHPLVKDKLRQLLGQSYFNIPLR